MSPIIDWVAERWQDTLIPLAVFLASLIVFLWVKRLLARGLERWVQQTRWQGGKILLEALSRPSFLWVILISAYLGLQASPLGIDWKTPIGRSLGTLLILSVALLLVRVFGGWLLLYGERLRLPSRALQLTSSAISAAVLVVAGLIVLELWGAPIGPLLLILGIATVAAGIVLRETLLGWFAFLQINATNQIKVGDYIKLESGEEGYVLDIGWMNTQLKALDESIALIPNSKLLATTVVNYGRPLKKAKEPFRFYSRTHLKELTGLKARTCTELTEILKTVPDSVVYYHTHHFLEEHHFLTPEPPNDFAAWVSHALGEEALGEKLAAVDTFEFPSLGALRERLVGILEEHLAHTTNHRVAPEGQEFHFVKSISFIIPTPYVAHDLREFAEALRKLPLGSLYFHIFESRLRLGRGVNDFSVWLEDSLGEEPLADEIARLDPYNYTLEGLRSLLIRLIEKRIK